MRILTYGLERASERRKSRNDGGRKKRVFNLHQKAESETLDSETRFSPEHPHQTNLKQAMLVSKICTWGCNETTNSNTFDYGR